MKTIDQIKQLLSQKQRVVITNHNNPDGDAMGSALGLYHYLLNKGHEVVVVAPTQYPHFLHFLPGDDTVVIAEESQGEANQLVKDATLIFSLDYNDLSRINFISKNIAANTQATKIMIDHHLEPKDFADIQISKTTASSTCELIYDLIVELGDKELIDQKIAKCLYTGLVTDTGRFKFALFTNHPHEIAAHLLTKDIQPAEINRQLFDNFSLNDVKFIGFCLSERLELLEEFNTGIIHITDEDLKRYNLNYKTYETGPLLAQAMSIQEVKILALFIERGGPVKISFRTKEHINVRALAAEHFEGGGHKNAAGGKTTDIQSGILKLKSVLPHYFEDADYISAS